MMEKTRACVKVRILLTGNFTFNYRPPRNHKGHKEFNHEGEEGEEGRKGAALLGGRKRGEY
jgi:hypothetical protein